jgi:hypothetical protein
VGTATTQMFCQASQDPFFFRGDLFEGPVGVYHCSFFPHLLHWSHASSPNPGRRNLVCPRGVFFISLTLMFDVDVWCQSLVYGLIDHHQKQQETYPWNMKRKLVSTELYIRPYHYQPFCFSQMAPHSRSRTRDLASNYCTSNPYQSTQARWENVPDSRVQPPHL